MAKWPDSKNTVIPTHNAMLFLAVTQLDARASIWLINELDDAH
jgi:hypothetical protein